MPEKRVRHDVVLEDRADGFDHPRFLGASAGAVEDEVGAVVHVVLQERGSSEVAEASTRFSQDKAKTAPDP
jgi:hypothetical protein